MIMAMNVKVNILNAVLFQSCWFIAVLLKTEYALFAIAAVLAVYFYSIRNHQASLSHMAIFLLLFSLVGFLGDSLIAFNTGLVYNRNLGMLGPVWLLVLWMAFATTLMFSMKWIFMNAWLTVFVGVFIAPLSYVAGIYLSNSYFVQEQSYSLFIVLEGIWWGFILFGYRKVIEIYEVKHEKLYS